MSKVMNITLQMEASDLHGFYKDPNTYYGFCPWEGKYKTFDNQDDYEDEYREYLTDITEQLLFKAIDDSKGARR